LSRYITNESTKGEIYVVLKPAITNHLAWSKYEVNFDNKN